MNIFRYIFRSCVLWSMILLCVILALLLVGFSVRGQIGYAIVALMLTVIVFGVLCWVFEKRRHPKPVMGECPYSDGNLCTKYLLQGLRCQDCPLLTPSAKTDYI